MKQRVADFIADYLADNGVRHVFSVVGGMAMHLNNAFGTNERLNVLYNHHEQACTIAAESYSRAADSHGGSQLAAVCVTSGPGGTNALTGVLCAYQDNLPMIVISGQVRSDITVESVGLDLRQFGEQEYTIVKSAAPMTKYAVMVTDAEMIKYHLGKALHLAQNGRRGPCWIDIPLDIQGKVIETDNLKEYAPENAHGSTALDPNVIADIAAELQSAERPVIIAGSAVRTSGALASLYKLAEKLKLPVICPTSTVDIMSHENTLYYGMFGVFGGRAGNYIVQNADLLVSLGARLSFKQIGFNYEAFSPDSRKVVVDTDAEELKKPTVKIDIPVCADVKDVIEGLCDFDFDGITDNKHKWLEYCGFLKRKFAEPKREKRDSISAYDFADKFWKKVSDNTLVVLGNNCAAVSMLQNGIRTCGQRLYGNVNCGTMGYDIPAAIGAAVARGGEVFCVTGEGSFQMNIQELQTIVHYDLPVKIVVFNNNSYQAIVNTQANFFKGEFAGCNNESGVSFPSFAKLADAYGFPHITISRADEIDDAIEKLLNIHGRAILELVQTAPDPIEPKLSSKKTADGSMVSTSIDVLFPFLSDEEHKKCTFEDFSK
jgi:acetolactate synthase-1/2/3 large subunit